MDMENIKPGKYVEIVYDLYKINPDGSEELVHQVDPDDPETFIFGVTTGMVAPLEKALEGLSQGDSYDAVATAEEGFGVYNDEYVVDVEKQIFLVDGKFDDEMVREGNVIPMMTGDGMRVFGKVLEVKPDVVRIDFNHPLAGASVRFKGTVKTVRDASEKEIELATRGCGCSGGCGCDDSSSCEGGGCGGGCCG